MTINSATEFQASFAAHGTDQMVRVANAQGDTTKALTDAGYVHNAALSVREKIVARTRDALMSEVKMLQALGCACYAQGKLIPAMGA
jgi:hypothetical protein